MTEEYEIEIVDNHIIAKMRDKRVLIDTGAPQSIADERPFLLLGDRYEFPQTYNGIGTRELSNFVGTEIHAMLGGDVLSEIYFVIDWQELKMQVSTDSIQFTGSTIPVRLIMNVPLIKLEINQNMVPVFLDTSAKLSYLNSMITNNHERTGVESDFYPGFGQFETSLYNVEVGLGDRRTNIRFGNLPQGLEGALNDAGANGILGNDIFEHFTIYFDMPNRRIVIEETTTNKR